MSIWTTKSLDRAKDYIVLRHPLKGVNNVVNGVIFRQGFAVVERNSKTYHHLKKIPVLHKSIELPLLHLKKLQFITRVSDIKTVYGQDVYKAYLEAEETLIQEELEAKAASEVAEQVRRKEELEKLKLAEQQLEQVQNTIKEVQDTTVIENSIEQVASIKSEIVKCCYVKPDGNLCKMEALDYSPSKFCSLHLLEDDKLSKYDIKLPPMMTKQEKKHARKAVHKKLKSLKAKGEL